MRLPYAKLSRTARKRQLARLFLALAGSGVIAATLRSVHPANPFQLLLVAAVAGGLWHVCRRAIAAASVPDGWARPLSITIAALALLLAALLGTKVADQSGRVVSGVPYLNPTGRVVSSKDLGGYAIVPDVVGLSPDGAQRMLFERGFRPIVVSDADPSRPRVVTAQQPAAGSRIVPPDSVNLWVAYRDSYRGTHCSCGF